jgi:hypothetical protein
MGSLEAHEQRVNQYSKQPIEHAFQIKANFSDRRGASFHQQREEDHFTEEAHMEEQEKVRITAETGVGAKEEEERIFNQE